MEMFKEVLNKLIDNAWYIKDVTGIDELVAGDTDSFFIETSKDLKDIVEDDTLDQDTKLDKIEEICTSILEDTINTSLLKDFLHEILNVPIETNTLSLEYEVLGHSYNLPVKKRYAFYSLRPDKDLIIKGLETERSDYPQRTREMLHRILEMILIEKKSISDIKLYIEEKRKEFSKDLEKWDITLARPVSWTKEISEYKVVPTHVVSMIAWNKLVGDEVFLPGSKGYAFKIVVNNRLLGKWYSALNEVRKELKDKYPKTEPNILVLPENPDTNLIPKEISIDTKEMIKFILDDRVKLLLAGIVSEDEWDSNKSKQINMSFSLSDILKNKK